MLKVYADERLGVEKGPFPRPIRPLSVEIDCSKHDQMYQAEGDSTIVNDFQVEELNQDDIY
jgi:penicillin-binding protein 1A